LADDTVGLYLGGSLAESQQRFDATTFNVRASDPAYKFALGYRLFKVLAAEVSYVGFGRAYGGFNFADTDAIGAFAVAFLPIPVVDVFGMLGMADWRTDAQSPFHSFHRTGADLAYGAGAGTSWGSLGARVGIRALRRFACQRHGIGFGRAHLGVSVVPAQQPCGQVFESPGES
jgi:hypothetical protein